MTWILYPFCSIVGILVFAILFADFVVYGRLLQDEEIDAFLSKYYSKLKLNELDRKGRLFHLSGSLPYIGRRRSLLWKWEIQDYGCIPRWSRWSKKLDEKRIELLPTIKNKLSGL